MGVNVGVNGLGRVGRALVRHLAEIDDLDVVAVNDLADASMLTRLLRSDSTFGPFEHDVSLEGDTLVIDGAKVAVTSVATPVEIDWAAHGVEIVIESTGRFRTRETAAGHLGAGASKVIVSAPGKGVDATIVMGINDHVYDPAVHHVISNASCTTNCVAPMVKVLDDAFGLDRGFMTTVHAYTNDQNLLDGPHKDARRARAAAVNIIPTTTGAAKAVGEVLPHLAGRLDGLALRVPVVDGSLVDLAVLLDREVTADEVNAAFESAAREGPLVGALQFSDDAIVSSDIVGSPFGCVFDSELTQAAGRFAKVFGWYDNEWGYMCRLTELTRLVAAGLA
jgi:glyceraldehyde 3-phosphate dehydrogenase